MNQSVAEPDTVTHADGPTLVAVAEGRAEGQPSDEMLGHIFSCPQCHESLQEIRAGLQAMGTLPDLPNPDDTEEDTPWPAELALGACSTSESTDPDPGRFIKKMAIAGGVAVVAMILLRYWLSSMA